MSKLFNLDYLVEDSNTNDVTSLDSLVENTNVSYTSMALSFLTESNKTYNLASKLLYKSIIESNGEVEAINESFETFFQNVKDIIDKFLKFVKSMFDRFIVALNRFFKSEKYLTNHLSDLDDFSSKDEFKFTGYEYTISNTVPVLNALAEFDMEFIGGKDETGANRKTITKDNIAEVRKNLEYSLSNGYYDQFRADVLGKGGPIYQSDYDDALFREYRNDNNSTIEITATKYEINVMRERYKNHKKTEQAVKRDHDRIKREYEGIKKLVEKMYRREKTANGTAIIDLPNDSDPVTHSTPIALNNQEMLEFDLFIKAKTNQVEEMSAIHLLAFSAKLDAIAECYKQDKAVLYKALDRVKKYKKED